MKSKSFLFVCCALLMAGFALQSCKNKNEVEVKVLDSQLLVVERQEEEVIVGDEFTYPLNIQIDIPISGPQMLVDSLTDFFNEKMYEYCEKEGGAKKQFDKVRTNNIANLLQHYFDIYKPYFLKEVEWSSCFSIVLLAQTENYVTYGLTHHHCGGSCGSEMFCYTFSKRNGHRLSEIISHENLDKFYADHKHYKKWEYGWEYTHLDLPRDYFGLLEDSLLFAVNDVGNHYEVSQFGYEKILSYLSKEAQQFIAERGDKASCLWKNWYVGKRLGTVVAESGDTIYLMERGPISDLVEDFTPNYIRDSGVQLLTYHRKDGGYIPCKALKTSTGLCASLESWADSRYNYFDEAKGELHVSYLNGKHEESLRIYRFDGNQFVDTGKDMVVETHDDE